MKVTKVIAHNIGPLEDVEVEVNQPLTIFYGEVRQGKTSVLNAVRWALGAPWPTDIIRHGEDKAYARVEFDNGSCGREWYVSKKDGTTKAKSLTFILDGIPVQRPAEAIAKFLNPFLLDQNHLVNMTETERRKFFATVFQTASEEELKAEAVLTEQAKEARAEIKRIGTVVVPEKVDVPSTDSIRTERDRRNELYQLELKKADEQRQELSTELDKLRSIESEGRNTAQAVESASANLHRIQTEMKDLREKLAKAEAEMQRTEETYNTQLTLRNELAEAYKVQKAKIAEIPAVSLPEAVDTSDLDAQLESILDLKAQNARRQEALEKQKKLKEAEVSLRQAEHDLSKVRQDRVKRLERIVSATGIPSLSFDQNGTLSFEGTSVGMLSTSQLMRLSEFLTKLFPEGIGLDLIDRAESLGHEIFEFIDEAKRDKKSILATVVGDKPANVPDEVGVFVVKDGRIE